MKKALEKVRFFIQTHQLLSDGARVLVGLSGGPDSVCLALLLNRLGYEVVAAHCNFHLRGEESMRDEQFVTDLCLRKGWTLRKENLNTEAYARQQGISIEMAAREYRYDWFRRLLKEVGAEAIAVGHHQDDNVETMLLNLTRGTGIKGLCGMQPRNGDVVRPLLCLTRKEVQAFLQEMGQNYVTDHTNLEDEYARNKVRLDVLPQLERINQGAAKNMTSTMENLREVMKVYQEAMKGAISQCVEHQKNGEIFIHIETLKGLPSPISVLHEVLSPLGFNKVQINQMVSALDKCGKVFEAEGRRVLIDRAYIIVEAEQYSMPDICQEVIPIEELTIEKDPRIAYLDADKLRDELTLRTPIMGDTFAPFGMKGKRKLLSDYLTDLKLNLFEKERQPLLMDGEEIAWVVGKRSSDLYRVDSQTTRVIRVSLLPQ